MRALAADHTLRSHCIPIYDTFRLEYEGDVDFVVFPFLRPFEDPHFEYVGEVIDFVDQLLQARLVRFLVWVAADDLAGDTVHAHSKYSPRVSPSCRSTNLKQAQ